MNPPKCVTSLKEFEDFGKVLKAFQILDVVFVYDESNKVLHHYRGVFGGWVIYSSTPYETEEGAQKHIQDWFDQT